MEARELELPSPICVTGAAGFIASWIVKYLLEAGVTVHATVRDRNDTKKLKHLTDLLDDEGVTGKLEFFEADLLKEGSFDEAIAGCKIVMHTASPFFLSGIKDAQTQLVEPALKGTRTVLEACNRSPSVEKVVLTSSVAAIYSDNSDCARAPNGMLDETAWNETSSTSINPYSYSKTVAEREAWKIAEAQDRWTLATINPSMVLGPTLSSRTDSTSVDLMRRMTDGTFRFGAPNLVVGMVDVRDVAMAHLLAAANSDASGRHILSNRTLSFLEIGQTMRAEIGDKYPFPKGYAPNFFIYLAGPFQGLTWRYLKHNLGLPLQFDNSRSQTELGLTYRPANETLKDAIERLEDLGLVGR